MKIAAVDAQKENVMVVKPFKNMKKVKDTTLLDLIPVLEGNARIILVRGRDLLERRGRCARVHQTV